MNSGEREGEALANLKNRADLLRREGAYSNVWFADALLEAADDLDSLHAQLSTRTQPATGDAARGISERARELLAAEISPHKRGHILGPAPSYAGSVSPRAALRAVESALGMPKAKPAWQFSARFWAKVDAIPESALRSPGGEERAVLTVYPGLLSGDPQTWSFRVVQAVRAAAEKVPQRALAKQMRLTDARVSQLLGQCTNWTISTVEKILVALAALDRGKG